MHLFLPGQIPHDIRPPISRHQGNSMTDHLTSSGDKQRFWSDRVAAWKDSGLSQQKYCEQEQLTYTTFIYWRGRLKQLADDGAAAGKVNFVPVIIIFQASSKPNISGKTGQRGRLRDGEGHHPGIISWTGWSARLRWCRVFPAYSAARSISSRYFAARST